MTHLPLAPIANLADGLSRVFATFADELRAHQSAHPDPAPSPASAPTPSASASDTVEAKAPKRDESRLGAAQVRVLDVLKEAGAEGLTSAQVADQTGLAATNTPRALKKLQERGLVTSTDEKPAIWRLVEEVAS